MEYNYSNGFIRWQISTSHEHFSLTLTIFEIFTFQNVWPWKCRYRSWHRTIVVTFDDKCSTSYLMAIVMFARFFTIYKLLTNQEKCPNFHLKNEGQGQAVEKRDLCHSSRNDQIHMGDFFSILASWQHTFMQKNIRTHTYTKAHAHVHTNMHTERNGQGHRYRRHLTDLPENIDRG